MTHSSSIRPCPHCGRPLPEQAPAARCPRCALPLSGELFDRLRWTDAELHRLDQQRAMLLAHRAGLLDALRAGAAGAPGAPGGAVPGGDAPVPGHPGAPGGWPTARQRPEASPGTARNVLLALGGVLLTVAALAFTLLSWGSMGIGGRAAVLATVTLVAAGTPVLLLRRALHATAEAVAGVGLVLLLLDAYALRQVRLQHTDAVAYTAGAVAVIAVLWTAYGLALARPRGTAGTGEPGTGLRVPLPAALVLAQLPVPLWAVSAGAGHEGMAWALLATAAADVLLAVLLPALAAAPPPAVRTTAGVTSLVTGGPALLLTAWLSLQAHEPPAAARAAALLLTSAGVLLFAGHREKAVATPLGCAAGLLLVAASGGMVRTLVPSGAWVVPGYLLCAVVLAGAVIESPPQPVRGWPARQSPTAGLLLAAAVTQALAVVYAAPAVAQALLEPLGRFTAPWQGAPHAAPGGTLLTDMPWGVDAGTPLLLAVPALALAAAARVPRLTAVRGPAAAAALTLACAAAVVIPLALGLPYAAVTCWLVALVVGLLVLSATVPALASPAALAALVTGLTAAGWALAERTATFAALTVLGAAFAAAAGALLRRPAAAHPADARAGHADGDGAGAAGAPAAAAATGPDARPGLRLPSLPPHAVSAASGAACAVAAVLCAAGLARALPAALDVPAEQAAFAVFALAAATAPLAARLRHAGPRPTEAAHHARGPEAHGRAAPAEAPAGGPAATAGSLAVECTGYAVAGWAVALATPDAPLLSLALGLSGVLAGGVALRDDRRPAGYAATGLFLLATWVRLYASEVSVPEAYGLPLAVAAFAVGLLRARRTPGLSSWAAYGPALSCALLPSTVMIWSDPHWVRPLLLGTGSLAVTLLGARLRLQAPLLFGGGVLALVAGHELAPYVTQVIGMLPRWLPPALAGLLLLGVGATYEHRMRDARRLRAAWRRLG